MSTWRDYGYKVEDCMMIGKMYVSLEAYLNKRIADLDKEPEGPETLTREPNKGERLVLGKEKYQKA